MSWKKPNVGLPLLNTTVANSSASVPLLPAFNQVYAMECFQSTNHSNQGWWDRNSKVVINKQVESSTMILSTGNGQHRMQFKGSLAESPPKEDFGSYVEMHRGSSDNNLPNIEEQKNRVYHALKLGSSQYFERELEKSLESFEVALKILDEFEHPTDFKYSHEDIFLIKLCKCIINIEIGAFSSSSQALNELEPFAGNMAETYPCILYLLGKCNLLMLNFKKALEYFYNCQYILLFSAKAMCSGHWPESSVTIQETDKNYLLENTLKLLKICTAHRAPDIICKDADCVSKLQHFIYLNTADFEHYTSTNCSEQCCFNYHPRCYAKLKQTLGAENNILGSACLTPQCQGLIISVVKRDSNKEIVSEKRLPSSKLALLHSRRIRDDLSTTSAVESESDDVEALKSDEMLSQPCESDITSWSTSDSESVAVNKNSKLNINVPEFVPKCFKTELNYGAPEFKPVASIQIAEEDLNTTEKLAADVEPFGTAVDEQTENRQVKDPVVKPSSAEKDDYITNNKAIISVDAAIQTNLHFFNDSRVLNEILYNTETLRNRELLFCKEIVNKMNALVEENQTSTLCMDEKLNRLQSKINSLQIALSKKEEEKNEIERESQANFNRMQVILVEQVSQNREIYNFIFSDFISRVNQNIKDLVSVLPSLSDLTFPTRASVEQNLKYLKSSVLQAINSRDSVLAYCNELLDRLRSNAPLTNINAKFLPQMPYVSTSILNSQPMLSAVCQTLLARPHNVRPTGSKVVQNSRPNDAIDAPLIDLNTLPPVGLVVGTQNEVPQVGSSTAPNVEMDLLLTCAAAPEDNADMKPEIAAKNLNTDTCDSNSAEQPVVLHHSASNVTQVESDTSQAVNPRQLQLINNLQQYFPKYNSEDIQKCLNVVRDEHGGLTGLKMSNIRAEMDTIFTKWSEKKPVDVGKKVKPAKSIVDKSPLPWCRDIPDESCSICIDLLSESPQTKLVCNHSFHTECISQWLQTHSDCPICRVHTVLDESFPATSW